MSAETVPQASTGYAGSDAAFTRLGRSVPQSVNSGVRIRRGRTPFFASASGIMLTDVDGNRFIDTIMGYGPVLFGHGEPEILRAVHEQIDRSVICGAESARTAEVAERLIDWIPCAERIIFSSSGSEAVQAALRVARAATGRHLVLRFEGHYHGWVDPMHTNAAGTPAQRRRPAASGIDVQPNAIGQNDVTAQIVVTHWNDVGAFDAAVSAYADELAAVIMEPIPFNAGTYRADPGYLEHVREVCTRRGIMLIFDEVVSGFRAGRGGAQELLGVTPDLATFAKAVAGGFPLSAVAGSAAAMAPLVDGRLRHAGTYNANPVSIAAAEATTRLIASTSDLYTRMESTGSRLAEGLRSLASGREVPLRVNQIGSVLQLFWSAQGGLRDYASCSSSNSAVMSAICEGMLDFGVFSNGRGLMMLGYRHEPADVDRVLEAFALSLDRVLREVGDAVCGVHAA
ncbi:MAG: aminotransferase class III-fold pyridoxal phosphate-dependent enzyme [Microbacterium sp.]